MNDKSFEHHKKTLEEIEFKFFCTLYFWTTAFVSFLVISYNDFFFFFYLHVIKCFLLYTWRSLMLLVISQLLIKK
jgi:hypothetical protein